MPLWLRAILGLVGFGLGLWRLAKALEWKNCKPMVSQACLTPTEGRRILSLRIVLQGSSGLYRRWDLRAVRFRVCVLPSNPASPEKTGNIAFPWFVRTGPNGKGDVGIELAWELSPEEWRHLRSNQGAYISLREALFETNHGRFHGAHDGTALTVGEIERGRNATS